LEQFYKKAITTLKFLTDEQGVDISRIKKIKEIYKELTIENALKLHIRCKLAFENKRKLLGIMIKLDEYDQQKL
jgi:hypothetical protein